MLTLFLLATFHCYGPGLTTFHGKCMTLAHPYSRWVAPRCPAAQEPLNPLKPKDKVLVVHVDVTGPNDSRTCMFFDFGAQRAGYLVDIRNEGFEFYAKEIEKLLEEIQ